MRVQRISDLLHFRPVLDAKLIVATVAGEIGHETSLLDLFDDGYVPPAGLRLLRESTQVLRTVGRGSSEILRDLFGVRTIEQLAQFAPFLEAQRYLQSRHDDFREASSAPAELMPAMVGGVASSTMFSSFVRERSLRFTGLELTYDASRIHYVDPRLAALFEVESFPGLLSPESSGSVEPVMHLGYTCRHTQQSINCGMHLGELIKSLSLAPDEGVRIAVLDWTRSQQGTRQEDTTVRESLTNELFHVRALDEVTTATAEEHQHGNTWIGAGTLMTAAGGGVSGALSWALQGVVPGAAIGAAAGAIAGTIEPGLGNLVGAIAGAGAGAVIGMGIGGAVSAGSSILGAGNAQLGTLHASSNGERTITGELAQNIMETIQQKASAVRSLRSTIIVTDDQTEHEGAQTRIVRNHNHSHMLNLEYFEVLQRYRTELRLTAAEPLLFLPFRPLTFSADFIQEHWETLRLGIDSLGVRKRFERILDRATTATTSAAEERSLASIHLEIAGDGPALLARMIGVEWLKRAKVTLLGAPSLRAPSVKPRLDSWSGVRRVLEFDFQDDPPLLSALTGFSFGNVIGGPTVAVRIVIGSKAPDGSIAFRSLQSELPQPEGDVVSFTLPATESSEEAPAQEGVRPLEAYFNERRYFFTRLLLLTLEQDQLTSLVESLQIQRRVEGIAWHELPRGADFQPFTTGVTRLAARVVSELSSSLGASAIEQLGTALKDRTTSNQSRSRGALQRALEASFRELASTYPTKENARRVAADRAAEVFVLKLAKESGLVGAKIRKLTDTWQVANVLFAEMERLPLPTGVHLEAVHLAEFVHPEPLAITGNTLVFRMRSLPSEQAARIDLGGALQPLIDQPNAVAALLKESELTKQVGELFLPTGGVFGEAILGRANASEKIDPTRFYNWQDSPSPDHAPEFVPIQLGARARDPLSTEPNIPAGELNIMNPPAFPDPTGLSAAFSAVQNGNIFRDMSKSGELVTVLSNLANLASQTAQTAGTMAGTAQAKAVEAATEIGKQVAQITAELAAAPTNTPKTPTDRGAALNTLEGFDATASGGRPNVVQRASAQIVGANLSSGGAGAVLNASMSGASGAALLVLNENTGDLGVLFQHLPVDVPALVRTTVEGVVDFAVEELEKLHLSFAAAKGTHYREVVLLEDERATVAQFNAALTRLGRAGLAIDVITIGHGTKETLLGYQNAERNVHEYITKATLADLKNAYGGPLPLRAVYMMNCQGGSLNQAWIDLGAIVSAGSEGNNFMPEPWMHFFWENWKAGLRFGDAVRRAYDDSKALWHAGYWALESAGVSVVPGKSAADLIADSAPVFAGDDSLVISLTARIGGGAAGELEV